MSDNRGDTLTSFLLGAAVGAGVALLLAPDAGPETRRRLGDAANRLSGNLGDKMGGIKDEIKQRASDVKSAIGERRTPLMSFWETATFVLYHSGM